jgi:hypothetical protein
MLSEIPLGRRAYWRAFIISKQRKSLRDRPMGSVPIWASEIASQVCLEHNRSIPEIIVRQSRMHPDTSGSMSRTKNRIVVTFGTRGHDHRQTLLHELAHYGCGTDYTQGSGAHRLPWKPRVSGLPGGTGSTLAPRLFPALLL